MTSADTIYAVCSGAGKAGIAVIRVSGPDAGATVAAVAGGRPEARYASVRVIVDPVTGDVLDRAVVLWMPGPASFTGEDVAEFHVHGSIAVISGLFRAFSGMSGLRPAEPGEFTRRAFANGRVDLVETEGLADLLNARTGRQRQQAMYHLLGRASSVYEDWRLKLLRVLGRVEAAVDFVEEEGVAESAIKTIERDITALSAEMVSTLATASQAAAIRSGIKVVLAGAPNTGKSSLLNLLARRDAAIVSSRPGTTRDVIEVAVEIEGLSVVLTDTAGLRDDSVDEIENIGMAKTRRELVEADLIVWVSSPDVQGSERAWNGVEPSLRVLNKIDLAPPGSAASTHVAISARSGAGVPEMVEKLAGLIREKYGHAETPIIVRERQKQAVMESIRHLNDSLLQDPSQLELMAEELRKAARSLARITGRIDVEDLLAAIFSEFCIGK
jgi:tRNA modification GTPase